MVRTEKPGADGSALMVELQKALGRLMLIERTVLLSAVEGALDDLDIEEDQVEQALDALWRLVEKSVRRAYWLGAQRALMEYSTPLPLEEGVMGDHDTEEAQAGAPENAEAL